MAQFLQGNKTTNTIAWLDKHEATEESAANNGLVHPLILRGLTPVIFVPTVTIFGIAYTMMKDRDSSSPIGPEIVKQLGYLLKTLTKLLGSK